MRSANSVPPLSARLAPQRTAVARPYQGAGTKEGDRALLPVPDRYTGWYYRMESGTKACAVLGSDGMTSHFLQR